MSAYSGTAGRTSKPFNPLLGETYEFVCAEQGFRFIAEKVEPLLLMAVLCYLATTAPHALCGGASQGQQKLCALLPVYQHHSICSWKNSAARHTAQQAGDWLAGGAPPHGDSGLCGGQEVDLPGGRGPEEQVLGAQHRAHAPGCPAAGLP